MADPATMEELRKEMGEKVTIPVPEGMIPVHAPLVDGTATVAGSRQGQVYRPYSIRVSACVGLPGVGAGPARGMWEGQVALVRPWAAFGRPRGLERGHSGGSMYKVGFGRGRLLPTSVVLIDLY